MEVRSVTLVTPGACVGEWSRRTDEQFDSQRRLLELGVRIVTATELHSADTAAARLACVYSGAEREVAADALLLVTARTPRDELYQALVEDVAGGRIAGLHRVGDCHAPGAIVHALYSGHRLPRELGEANPLRALRERP